MVGRSPLPAEVVVTPPRGLATLTAGSTWDKVGQTTAAGLLSGCAGTLVESESEHKDTWHL
jgi:hypothetical protein